MTTPARLIRFTDLNNGLLSSLDTAKNILFIDRIRYDMLADLAKDRIVCSDEARTRIVETPHGYFFEAF